ncbi:MAG: hypothetical protein IJQ87_04915 [Clostridia bacterium]|nr:hypothetical protein [Clostridia bacterium]
MKKSKAIVLLTIALVITAILTFLTFARFPVGTKNFNGFLGAIQTDYDLSGGTAYTLTLSDDNINDVDDVDEVINTLKYRLNLLGYENYSVKAIKDVDAAVEDYDIRIEARGSVSRFGEVDTDTLASDIKVAAAYGELTFYGGTSQNPTEQILDKGNPVADAYYMGVSNNGDSTTYNVNIKFSNYGYDALMELLNANSTYYVQINLGDTVLLPGTSALSSSYINDKSLIITTGSEASARQAALQIKTGGLAYKYDVSEGEDVSSPLGRNLEVKSIITISLLLVAIIAAMFVIDKKYGVVSCLSTIVFTDIYLFLMIAIPGIKISIGGVIGFALATVLLADGFMIISKRIKEEFARGKTVKSAVKTGFKRALLPIAGTAGITAASAFILFALTGGALKNFALVFAVGVVLAAAINLLVSRMFANLILAIVKYDQSFLGLKRTDKNAEEAGE